VAEKTVLVCDVCGADLASTVILRIGGSSWRKDLCETHLTELLDGARRPTRGARAGRQTPSRGAPRKQEKITTRARRPGVRATRRRTHQAVAAQAKKLRGSGLSYRQIGEALIKGGMKPPRAKAWNRVVIGRMIKADAA